MSSMCECGWITWAAEGVQQVVVGGWSLAGQNWERRCYRGKLGQFCGKVSRETGSSLTEKSETQSLLFAQQLRAEIHLFQALHNRA